MFRQKLITIIFLYFMRFKQLKLTADNPLFIMTQLPHTDSRVIGYSQRNLAERGFQLNYSSAFMILPRAIAYTTSVRVDNNLMN